MYLKNCWYQAGWGEEVAPGQPLVRTLLGEPILFWRDEDGSLHALLDMCPHRFAPLSKGTIAEGRVTCGYHGLAFGSDGACVHNPYGPVTHSMKVRAFPVIERHLAIWFWPGYPDKADPALLPDLGFIDDAVPASRIIGLMPTAADFRLLSDNILDLSHADYLHPGSLGGVMTSSKATTKEVRDKITARWEAHDCEPIPAARASIPAGAKADFWIEVEWQAPALMVLATATTVTGTPSTPRDEARTLHNMVPETATTTHYFFCSVRGFLTDDPEFGAYIKAALNHAFQNEDKPMIEAQQMRIGERDFWNMKPLLLKTDAAAVLARRKLEAMIAQEAELAAVT